MSDPRVLVIVPTFNEALNIDGVIGRLRAAVPHADVLIADDNSPDGTGRLADELAAADAQIHVLHRPGKDGLGAAYLAGFAWGLERGYDVLVEMDADGSHRPEDLPGLLAALKDNGGTADLVLGSRWVPGGAVVNWPASRKLISRGGTLYAKLALGIPIRDATGGFRAFRADTLRALDTAERRLAGLLLPDRPRLARGAARLSRRRGADHLRRARARRVQDEPRHRHRGAVAGHRLGLRAPSEQAAPAQSGPAHRVRRGLNPCGTSSRAGVCHPS